MLVVTFNMQMPIERRLIQEVRLMMRIRVLGAVQSLCLLAYIFQRHLGVAVQICMLGYAIVTIRIEIITRKNEQYSVGRIILDRTEKRGTETVPTNSKPCNPINILDIAEPGQFVGLWWCQP